VLSGAVSAPTAEALMRARYTAYVKADMDFLLRTMAPEVRPDFDPIEARKIADDAQWLSFELLAASAGGAEDAEGDIEYISKFRLNGQQRIHHERARFRRQDGEWLVCGGEVNPKAPPRQVEKIGRNDPCPCGSGAKYKKCCGR
jgi:SEC-C motif-containing protein